MIRFQFFPINDTPPDLISVIDGQYRAVFPNVGADGFDENGLLWSGGEYRVLAFVDDTWGAIAEILPRTIDVGGQAVRVGGVGGVMTLPHLRGQGLGKAVMGETARVICEVLACDAGMLFCSDENVPFYAQLGWQPLQAPVTHYQQGRSFTFDSNAMVRPCAGFAWPAGAVDVRGTLW